MAQSWYYTKDGKNKIGPVSAAQLKELARSGQLRPTDMVRSESTPKWIQAAQVNGLFGKRQAPSLSQQPAPLPVATEVESVPVATAAVPPAVGPRRALPPTDGTVRRRVLIGIGTGSGILLLGFCIVCGGMATFFGRGGRTDGGSSPDSSRVDYSADFSQADYAIPKVDYTKGPKGQQVVERDGKPLPEEKNKSVTEHGFQDDSGKFVRHGVMILWYERGKRKYAEDFWYNGKRHGLLTSWDQEGRKRLERGYKDGDKHGKETIWYENGKVKSESFWANGKQHGTYKGWHKTGQQSSEGAYNNGSQHGKCLFWYEDGSRKEESNWIAGKKHGTVVGWHPNGQKSLESKYVEGKEVGQHTEWHPNGKKSKEFVAVDGLRQGTFTEWHENGQKANEGEYKDGKEDGKWMQRHPDGSKAQDAQFVAGKQVGAQTDWYSPNLGGNIKAIATFVDGAKIREVVFFPAQTAGPRGMPLGPDHKMHEYNWTVLPGAAQPVPEGTWTDYNPNGSVKNIRRFKNGLPDD